MNDDKGLVERIAVLETKTRSLEKRAENVDSNLRYVIFGAGALVVSFIYKYFMEGI